ncbi:pyridoxamine 5'-phosphate oxidase [Trichoderma velutinum]
MKTETDFSNKLIGIKRLRDQEDVKVWILFIRSPTDPPGFESFPATPHEAFELWLSDAINYGVVEPHAIVLSTVSKDHAPDARVLILKDVDSRGWHFTIKAASTKGKQIANNSEVALTFYWKEQARQIRLQGRAQQLPEEECAKDFADRPRDSKVNAVASKQSAILGSRDELLEAVKEKKHTFSEEAEAVAASGWKVYAVAPVVMEFWQGSPDRLHHRLRYTLREEHQWEKQLL